MATAIEIAFHKVVRVLKQRHAIEDCVSAYIRANPYEIVPEPNGEKRIHVTNAPPDDIGIIAGEFLYQFRSALDHVFFDLIKRNPVNAKGVHRPTEWESKAQFPLECERPAGFNSGAVPKDKFRSALREWIPDQAFAFIERIQPYNRDQRSATHLMRLLAKLSNIDKHRHINTTVAVLERAHTITSPEGWRSSVVGFLDSGAKVDDVSHYPAGLNSDGPMQVDDKISVRVAFDEPELGYSRSHPIDLLIYDMPGCFTSFLLPNLNQFF